MKKLTQYFLIFLTTMILITGFGIWFLLKQFFPELLVDGYLIIPLFFYLFGLITIYFFRRSSPALELFAPSPGKEIIKRPITVNRQ